MANYTAITDMTLEEAITAGSMVDGEDLAINSGAVVTCTQTPSILLGGILITDGDFLIDGKNISRDNAIILVGEYQENIDVRGLGSFIIDGDYFSLGTTDGTDSQAIDLSTYYYNTPASGVFCVDVIPRIEIETGRRIYFDNAVGATPEVGDMIRSVSDDSVIGIITTVETTYLVVRYLVGSLSDNDNIYIEKVVDRSGPNIEVSWTADVDNVNGDIKEYGLYQQFGNSRANGISCIADYSHSLGGFVFDNEFQSTTITLGTSTGTTGGFLPPAGCDIRIANIHLCTSNISSYSSGDTYHDGSATEGNWYDLYTTYGGMVSASIFNAGFFFFASQRASSFAVNDAGSFVAMAGSLAGNKTYFTDCVVCSDPVSIAYFESYVFGKNQINGSDAIRCMIIASNRNAMSFSSDSGVGLSYVDCIYSSSATVNSSADWTVRFLICKGVTIRRMIVFSADAANSASSMFYFDSGTTDIDIRDTYVSATQDGSYYTQETNLIGLYRCTNVILVGLFVFNNSLPGNVLFYITDESDNVKIRAVGRIDKKIDAGADAEELAYIRNSSSNIDLARLWFANGENLDLISTAENINNVSVRNVSLAYDKRITPTQLDNIIMTGVHGGYGSLGTAITGTNASRYGRQFCDGFDSDTTGWIAYLAIAPSSTINLVTLIAGKKLRYDKAGQNSMLTGDIIEAEMDVFSKGHLSFTGVFTTARNNEPIGGDDWGASVDIYFQYDFGTGYNGSWLDLRNPSNLIGITGSNELEVNNISGTFAIGDALSWGTGATAGTGIFRSIDGSVFSYIVLTGVAISDAITITDGNSGATCTAIEDSTDSSLSVSGIKFKLRFECISSQTLLTAVSFNSITSLEAQLANLYPIDQNYVTIDINVLELNTGDPVDGARVYATAAAGGSMTVGTVIMNAISNSLGYVKKEDFLYTSNQPVSIKVRKTSTEPFYKNFVTSGIITSNGLSVNAYMIED